MPLSDARIPHPARRRLLAAAMAIAVGAFATAAACQENHHPQPRPVEDAAPQDIAPTREIVEVFATEALRGTLIRPSARPDDGPVAVVILLHDAVGPDPRSTPYVDQLIGAGLGVLEVLEHSGDAAAAEQAIRALAADPRIAGRPLGMLGFGAGARFGAGLQVPLAARALLYPGCHGLAALARPTPGERWLLLHGGADAANREADCAAAAAELARRDLHVRHRHYPHATYAWDYPAFGIAGVVRMPAPTGAGRAAVRAWPQLAGLTATQVAGFFADALSGPAR